MSSRGNSLSSVGEEFEAISEARESRSRGIADAQMSEAVTAREGLRNGRFHALGIAFKAMILMSAPMVRERIERPEKPASAAGSEWLHRLRLAVLFSPRIGHFEAK